MSVRVVFNTIGVGVAYGGLGDIGKFDRCEMSTPGDVIYRLCNQSPSPFHYWSRLNCVVFWCVLAEKVARARGSQPQPARDVLWPIMHWWRAGAKNSRNIVDAER